jgi:hypothetical protein
LNRMMRDRVDVVPLPPFLFPPLFVVFVGLVIFLICFRSLGLFFLVAIIRLLGFAMWGSLFLPLLFGVFSVCVGRPFFFFLRGEMLGLKIWLCGVDIHIFLSLW